MAVLLENQIWELRVACYTANQASINTFHFKVAAVAGAPADTWYATYFDTQLAALYKAILSDDAKYRGVSFQRVFPTPRTRPVAATPSDGVGATAGDMLPGQVAGIVTAKADFGGPKYRARFYAPFPGEADNEVPGRPSDVYVASLQAVANKVYGEHWVGPAAGVTDARLVPVIWHRGGGTSDEITLKTAKKLWATQRRRGDYGRLNTIPF